MNEIATAPLLPAGDPATAALPGDVLANHSDFLAALSHELRTPVTVIKALAQGLVLHWDELPAEKRYFYVERLLRSSLRMEHLVNDLSLAAGFMPGAMLCFSSFDLGCTVAQALDEVRVLHQTHAFSVVPDPGSATITADPRRLLQLLVTLLDTAARHAPPHQTVTLRWQHEPSALRVEIGDGARGSSAVPAACFIQSRPSNCLPRDTIELELGLRICKTLVEAMGGVIGISMPPGIMPYFWFTLPNTAA